MPYVDHQTRVELRPVLEFLKADLERHSGRQLESLFNTLSTFLDHLERLDDGRTRPHICQAVQTLSNVGAKAGNLNYVISVLLWEEYLQFNFSYSKLDAAIDVLMRVMERSQSHMGTLFCAASEIYARLGRPYEDKKISENGDVFI
jgi:hypothetical protein